MTRTLNMDVPVALAVLDMAAFGVRSEVGEQPFAWLEGEARAAPVGVSVPAALPTGKVLDVKPSPRAAKPKLPVMAMGPRTTPATSWVVGEGGGLVVLVRGMPVHQGKVPLDTDDMDLLNRMLVAAKAGDVTGWVVLGAREDMPRPEMQADFLAKVQGLNPSRVLVLGGAALGTLTGAASGVESWQNNPAVAGVDCPVGVTYPPGMLRQQPMLKRMAWYHLLAWQQRWEG